MAMNSLVQPDQPFTSLNAAEELPGVLEVPDSPEITAGYAYIYHGFWTTPQGERVEVAIKELRNLIPRDRQSEQEALKWKKDTRLKREVFVWSQIKHPNLHPLLGCCSQPQPRLISPWCHRGNLENYIQNNPSISRSEKLRLIYQAGCGLEHLHSRTPPICHGDIKPENVLINKSGEAAISDFGLSRVLQDLSLSTGFTTSEAAKGTFIYMAAELSAGEKPSRESDVYAFGGLILTVMSGEAPFHGLPHVVILRRVMQDQPPKPEDHKKLPGTDPLWNLMRRCWSNSPLARPKIREVLIKLCEYLRFEVSDAGFRPGYQSAIDISAGDYPNVDPGSLRVTQSEWTPSLLPPSAGATPTIFSGEVLLAAKKLLKSMEVQSKVIPVFGKYIEAATDVGLALAEIIQPANSSGDVLESHIWNLVMSLQDLTARLGHHHGDEVAAGVTDVQKKLQYLQGNVIEKGFFDFSRGQFSCDDIGVRGQAMAQKAIEQIQLLVDLDAASLIAEFENTELQKQQRRLLNCLGDGKYGASGNAIEDVICFPGTRMESLERIDNWIRDSISLQRVLWIRGMAGRGKSTIAATVAHTWGYRASCAIFHFRRGQNMLNARIFCALARQLGSSLIPEVKRAVLESVQENQDISDQRLDVQFKTLLVAPLSKLGNQLHPVLIVIDALDECENLRNAVGIVKLIDQHSSSFPPNVKFLLTCRPETPLLRTLEPRGWYVEDLDSSLEVTNDLARFIEQSCAQIREDHDLPKDWPSSSDIGRLVEMSQGLFQWARTAITYVGNGSPVNRLRDLLKRPSMWSGLDELYHQILSKAFENVRLDPGKQELLKWVLGILVVAPHPASLEVIAALYEDTDIFEGADERDIIDFLRKDILADLNSLLLIPSSPVEPMRLMHTSIRDLLVNEQRCKERPYYIDDIRYHERLANVCLDFMARCLKENICKLSDPSKTNPEIQDVVERKISVTLRYCCRAWSIHLTSGTHRPSDFEIFSKEKLLYWLEVMSLLEVTAEAIVAAKRVYQWLSECPTEISEPRSLSTLWNDAQRFITAFAEPISFGPLHIYVSALPHCPRQTHLWECYGRHAKTRTLRGVQPVTWPPNLWTRASDAPVTAVTFSPDGAILASGSDNGAIRLWDAQTGTALSEPLMGHSGWVNSVVFSPDGKLVASGSEDGTIRLWESQTGAPYAEPLTGHTSYICSVIFSPDGKVLAAGSDDGTIQLWDSQARKPSAEPLKGHSHLVYSVKFSSDGKVLASGSEDCTIRLWDVPDGTSIGRPLAGHSEPVTSVAFSPDDKVVASGSADGTIRFWDAQTQDPLDEPLTGHNDWVYSVAFSSDGKVLASGSDDQTIRLWNAQTRAPVGNPLTGHSGYIRSVAFSPKGWVLASGSTDGTIRLWDTQTTTPFGGPLPQKDVSLVAFSPDGKAMASGSTNGMFRLWDVEVGDPLSEPLSGHIQRVCSIVFSPDGKLVASGSCDKTVRLWDAQAGTPLLQPLRGHRGWIRSIAFSTRGGVLASASRDRTIRLWNVKTGKLLGNPLLGHSDWVRCVMFSKGDTILASASRDMTVRLWDVHTGTPFGEPLTGHSDWVRSLAFSPDGKILASASRDCTIRLWDVHTGQSLGEPLKGHSDWVRSVEFSPDGKTLASASRDRTTQLWDVQTRKLLGEQPMDQSGAVLSALFSQNTELSTSRLDFQDHWVKLSSFHLLWLPSQYWADLSPAIYLSNGRLVVISDGTLSIFDVSAVL